MTQQYVADRLGIGRESYARYENGSRNPSLQNLVDLADLFGVTTDYLLECIFMRIMQKRIHVIDF